MDMQLRAYGHRVSLLHRYSNYVDGNTGTYANDLPKQLEFTNKTETPNNCTYTGS